MQILELKIQKMEQLIKIKDSKIQSLVSKLQQAGIAWLASLLKLNSFYLFYSLNFNLSISLLLILIRILEIIKILIKTRWEVVAVSHKLMNHSLKTNKLLKLRKKIVRDHYPQQYKYPMIKKKLKRMQRENKTSNRLQLKL